MSLDGAVSKTQLPLSPESFPEPVMPSRAAVAVLALFQTLVVAGSNASARPRVRAHRNFYLPLVPRCTVEIERYAKIVYMDHRIGNVALDFDQIRADIASAAAACGAGRGAQARAIVIASERSHGHPWPPCNSPSRLPQRLEQPARPHTMDRPEELRDRQWRRHLASHAGCARPLGGRERREPRRS